ncbi:MAG: hypothetical protein L0241_18560 [Planctomycetia bacterium]|nr:hypothetical protein [Planctomycetia bacterium]
MRTFAFLLAVVLMASVGPVGAAPVPKHLMKEPGSDKGKLQGKWKLQSLRLGGMDVGGDLAGGIDMVLEFRGDKLIVTANIGGNGTMTGTADVKIESGAVKRISSSNIQTTDGNGKPINTGAKNDAFGYLLEGDKLILAATPGGGDGNTLADPNKPDKNTMIMVLTRVK